MIERDKRVAELIGREISLCLSFEVNDNRLKNVTIINAEISKDLKFCKVFFSVMGGEKEIKKAFSGFASSKNFIKRTVFSKVLLRVVPELKFEYYDGLKKASEISEIINRYNSVAGSPPPDKI